VRNNIAYAIEEADETAIWEAARLANALEFIRIARKALDETEDRGCDYLGQRQRITIARCLLRDQIS